jgi:hypothetical protein
MSATLTAASPALGGLAVRVQVERQVAHWRSATVALDDLENFASAAAWAGLEVYLGLALRRHLAGVVARLKADVDALAGELRSARRDADLARVADRVVAFRRRFTRTETVLDFYGDAVNTRTSPRLAALLTACDVLAVQAMTQVLRPLGREIPPVLTYVDKGLGASILRAGLRLWDGGSLSPVAAIKIVRHNLLRPTSLLHEAGHQVAHLTGWTGELVEAFRHELGPELGDVWAGWASEITADAFAFAHTGYGSVAALHDVLAGDVASVFRYPLGDPHPIPYLRVLLGVAMCDRCYGAGPWDDLARAWIRTHQIAQAPQELRPLLASVAVLPAIAGLCLYQPMRAFGGRTLAALADPAAVHPDRLGALDAEARRGMDRSTYWLLQESVRLLAVTSWRAATEPSHAAAVAAAQEAWMVRLGNSVQSSPSFSERLAS